MEAVQDQRLKVRVSEGKKPADPDLSPSSENGYRFERMSPDRFDDFAILAADAFGVRPSVADRERLFDTSAWGTDYIGYLAYEEKTGEVAAFYGIFPCYVEYGGRKYLAAQSGSTMTHSRHRKKGLFYQAGKRTFELAKREGIKFVYGFPNPNSYPGLMKLGWRHDGNLNAYHIFVPTLPLDYLANRFRFIEPLYQRWFRFVTGFWRTDYRFFASSAADEAAGIVCRDEGLLSYKRENDRRMMLRIGGDTVWLNRQNGSIGIGDVELANEEQGFDAVLRTLKLICLLTGSFHLRSYLSPGCKLDTLFQERGYRPKKGIAICHKDLDSDLPLEKFKYVYADFDTF